MEAKDKKKLLRTRAARIEIRINPELLFLLDKALEEDLEARSRSDFFSLAVIKYLEEKGVFK